MLSKTSRLLTYLTAVLYAVLGAFLFFVPEQLSPVFAWKVTAFMTMTIGGWCLGNAWLAFIAARRWDWSRTYSSLLFLGLFAVGELSVVYFFRDKLNLSHPIAWLYLATLLVNLAAALAALMFWLRERPRAETRAERTTARQYSALVIFIIFVGFLGLYGCVASIGAPGTNGGIFPEVMSLFTLRSFGVFYLSIALSVIPFLWDRSIKAILTHSIASYGLIVFITIAAFVYLRLFDFASKPGGLLYFAAYLGVGIPLLFIFRKYGTGN
jgi:hypothetical protein